MADVSLAFSIANWAYSSGRAAELKVELASAIDSAVSDFLSGESGVESSVTVAGKTFTYQDSMSLQERISTLRLALNNLKIALGETVENQEDIAHLVTFQIEH